jgi:hypothetical protein
MIGTGLFVAGVIGAAGNWSAVNALLIVGLVMWILALAVEKITKLVIKIAGGNELAHDLKAPSLTPKVATQLEETGLKGYAGIYAFIHDQFREDAGPGSKKTKIHLQDEVVEMVKRQAFARPVSAEEPRNAIRSGSAAERVLGFALLQADPKLGAIEDLETGLLASKSGNEQYHALLAAEAFLPNLAQDDRDRLRDALAKAPYIDKDRDRKKVKARLLKELASPAPLP